MLRKIAFRGKNRYRKEWLYGNLVQYKDGSFSIDGVPVETNSVGQFTGLLDKNRKEIYEGDVILQQGYSGKKPMLVRFEHKEIFTLADLLSLLPKEIEKIYSLEICADNVGWDIVYGTYHEGCEPKHIAADKELVNALYTALLWAIDHNHVKLD